MKKLIVFFALIITCGFNSFAQEHIAIQATPCYAVPNDWSTSSFELNAQYVRDLGNVFHLGAGIGLGTAKPIKYHSMWRLDDVEESEIAFFFPLFVRAKIDWSTKPSHPYFAFRAGTKLSSVEGFDGKSFNPYIANFAPAIGYDIKIGSHKLGIELVADAILGRYQEINYEYIDLLNDYFYEGFETQTDSAWASVGIAITFEF